MKRQKVISDLKNALEHTDMTRMGLGCPSGLLMNGEEMTSEEYTEMVKKSIRLYMDSWVRMYIVRALDEVENGK